MTHSRSARFLVKPTKESRFLQQKQESRRRLLKFRLKPNHFVNSRQAARWVHSLLKEAN